MNEPIKLELIPEQWADLLNAEGKYLPRCCGRVSAARETFFDILRENGTMHRDHADRLVREVSEHDAIAVAFHPNDPRWADNPRWSLAEGSPWPAIVAACAILQATTEGQPCNLHPNVKELLRFFRFDHLPPHLQTFSRPFHRLAHDMAEELTGNELTAGLRKLLEAKDCFVRAAIPR